MGDSVVENDSKKIKIGIVGAGFGASFFFHMHPNCCVEAVSAHLPAERELLKQTYKCGKCYDTLEALLKDKAIDAVALFTPAPFHASHTIQALNAGKHVLCAVPAAMTIEECYRVKTAVLNSGLTYMMAETSVYRQDTISAKKFFAEGRFGKVLSSEAEYKHPGLEKYFFDSNNNPTWRHGLPPMLYATHCTAFFIAVTNERLRKVSCIGWGDDSPLLKNNTFNNPFWNETALFTSEHNVPFNVNISWKGAFMPTERCEWHGEKMSFYGKNPHGLDGMLIHHSTDTGYDDAGFFTNDTRLDPYEQPLWYQSMLPEAMRLPSGHDNSHAFITHEFIDSVLRERLPEVNIHEAIKYTAPGIIAHQSALKDGECLTIPNIS